MTSAFKVAGWSARERPDGRTLTGRMVRLEKLDAARHGPDLGKALSGGGTASLYDYLGDPPPLEPHEVEAWARRVEASSDPFFLAIIDQASGRAVGRLALMRIDAANGVIEVGHVLYSPALSRSRHATEAQYLLMRHVFEDLGYRRYEWKCNALNEPSRNAARRLGFLYEGEFRQHMVVKGKNRDTAWFSITDREWPARRAAFEAWLSPDNFMSEGVQKTGLGVFMALCSAPAQDQAIITGLRRARPEDARALHAFQQAAYQVNRDITGRTPIPLTWDYTEAVRDWECWLSWRGDEIVAALLLHPRQRDLYLESIAVGPQGRDAGTGDALLRLAERRAGFHAGGCLRFLTNQALTRNVDWYLKRGFTIEKLERSEGRTLAHFIKHVRGEDHER